MAQKARGRHERQGAHQAHGTDLGGRKVAVIYCRLSDEEKRELESLSADERGTDSRSLEVQERRARAYCADRGYEVLLVVSVIEKSVYYPRKGLRQALAPIIAGRANVLVTRETDRIARDMDIHSQVRYLLRLNGAHFDFVKTGIPGDRPEDKMIDNFHQMMAEAEYIKISSRFEAGREARVEEEGCLLPSIPKWGWQHTDRPGRPRAAYIKDTGTPTCAATGDLPLRLYQEALYTPLRRLAVQWTAAGIPTPSEVLRQRGQLGGLRHNPVWNRGTIRSILTDPFYCGRAQARVTAYTRGKDRYGDEVLTQTRRAADDPKLVDLPPGTVEPLVPVWLWEAVQAKLQDNKAHRVHEGSASAEAALLIGGYLRCPYCGYAACIGPQHSGQPRGASPPKQYGWKYRCGLRGSDDGGRATAIAHPFWSMSARVLNEAVWDGEVLPLLSDPARVRQAIARRRAEQASGAHLAAAALASTRQDIAEAEREQAQLVAALARQSSPAAQAALDEALARASERLARARALLARLVREQEATARDDDRLAVFEQWSARQVRRLAHATIEQKQLVLWVLGVRVEVCATQDTARIAAWGGKRYHVSYDWDGWNAGADERATMTPETLAEVEPDGVEPDIMPDITPPAARAVGPDAGADACGGVGMQGDATRPSRAGAQRRGPCVRPSALR